MESCPKCGFSLPPEFAVPGDQGLNFCPRCGVDLKDFQFATPRAGDIEARALGLLREKHYFEAVKFVRDATQADFKTCKARVDEIARKYQVPPECLPGGGGVFWFYLIVAGFFGLMIASVGIALLPELGLVAKPFLCGGDLAFRSEAIVTLPGQPGYQTGVSRSFLCPDGTDRSLSVLFLSTCVYTLVLLVLLYVRRIWKRGRQ